MCQIVEAQPEIPLRFRAEDLVQFADLAGFRIDLEELIAQQRAQLRRMLVDGHRRFHDLEDSRLVLDLDAAVLLGGVKKLRKFFPGPFRLHIAGRDDGDQRANAANAIQQRVRQHVVAGQLGVAPDLRRLAQQLPQTHFQRAVQIGHPSLASFHQLHVVQVRVADEGVAFEAHGLFLFGCAAFEEPVKCEWILLADCTAVGKRIRLLKQCESLAGS